MKFSLIKEAIKVIKKRSKLLMVVLIFLFLSGIILGLIPGLLIDFLDDYTRTKFIIGVLGKFGFIFETGTNLIKEGKFFNLPLFIFINNLLASLQLTISGILIIPVFIFLYSTGTLIGALNGILIENLIRFYSPTDIVWILIVFCLEFASIVLATVEGIYLGLSIFYPKKIFKKKIPRKRAFIMTLKQTSKVYIIIIILLFIGSIIETLGIYAISQKKIEPAIPFEPCGIIFESTIENSPAEKIGLKSNYAIVKINDQFFHNATEFTELINNYSPGETIHLTNRKGEVYTLTLAHPPKEYDYTHGFIGIKYVDTAWIRKGKCII